MNWTRTDSALPPEGVEVDTITSSGQQQSLVFASNLWWFPDRSMYVYYVPTFWRSL